MVSFACLQRLADGCGNADDVKSGLRYADEALADHHDNAAVLAFAGLALASLGYPALGFRDLGFRYDEAERAIDHALRLSPNLLVVRSCAGLVNCIVGKGDAAQAHYERAIRISPLDPGMGAYLGGLGAAHLVAGRHEQALALAQQAVLEYPEFSSGHRLLLMALGHLGRIDEARPVAQRLLELAPNFTVSLNEHVSPFKDADFRKRCAVIYRAAGIPK